MKFLILLFLFTASCSNLPLAKSPENTFPTEENYKRALEISVRLSAHQECEIYYLRAPEEGSCYEGDFYTESSKESEAICQMTDALNDEINEDFDYETAKLLYPFEALQYCY